MNISEFYEVCEDISLNFSFHVELIYTKTIFIPDIMTILITFMDVIF